MYSYFNGEAIGNPEHTRMSIKKQKEYLSFFDDPKDEYERSYYKYKCFCKSCYYGRNYLLVLYNIGALCIYPFIYWKLIKRGKGKRKVNSRVDAVIENVPRLPNYDVIPLEIKEKYKEIYEITEINYQNAYLSSVSLEACKELRKRYFLSFYFRLITTFKLAQFNQYIQDYNPNAIVFYSCEREFSGPLQTYICEKEGVSYESFMHGDYLYDICFAFQRYTKYFTWDETYNAMFDDLRCEFKKKVYRPKKLQGIAENIDPHECRYYATYYFSSETREYAQNVRSVFNEFINQGLRCKVRPHPRFSDMNMLEEVFDGIEIENFTKWSLAESVTSSLYIVGLNTTVLSQAYFSGKKVVIDDISSIKEYNTLVEKNFIMLKRTHILFSELQRNSNVYDQSYRFVERENENDLNTRIIY